MNDNEVHENLGGLNEFKDWAKEEFDQVHTSVDEVHKKLDVVLQSKWRAEGAAAVIALVISLAVAIWGK